MRERLPDISITAERGTREWIRCIQGARLLEWVADDEVTMAQPDIFFVNFYAARDEGHRGLFGQLVHRGGESFVRLEMRANRWNSEELTYDAYVNQAKRFIAALEKSKQNCGELKIHIQSKSDLEPRLSERSAQDWKSFADHANWNVLHPLDDERFMDFVIGVHKRNEILPADDVQWLAIKRFPDEEASARLAQRYDDMRSILKRYDSQGE